MDCSLRMIWPRIPWKNSTTPIFPEPIRATVLPGLFDFSLAVGVFVPLSHTASTLLNSPWATWRPVWPLSREQVRRVPGHLAEQGTTPQRGAGLICRYLFMASRFSSMVNLMAVAVPRRPNGWTACRQPSARLPLRPTDLPPYPSVRPPAKASPLSDPRRP